MNNVYIYMHHDAFTFYLTDRKLSPKERYCAHCDASDELLVCCNSEQIFAEHLKKLFEDGYDLAPCENYLEIKDKYCPPNLRRWELDQFADRPDLYLAYETRLKQAAADYWSDNDL